MLRRSTVQVRCGPSASGSGILLHSGQVITNAHVLAGRVPTIETWEGKLLRASVVRTDRQRDLALLAVEGAPDTPVMLGDSGRLRSGMPVLAVGNPMGFVGAASSGVVHAVGQDWIQADLRLAPGNSGGPLATLSGEVVGINTMIARGGLAFAIPSRVVQAFLTQKPRPKLGFTARRVPHGHKGQAWLVLELEPNGPAERASLLPGDVVIRATREDADRVVVQFQRGGQPQIREVTVQAA